MRKLACLVVIAGLSACGSGGGGPTEPQVGSEACENDGQKQFVLENLYAWYLWNDLLPQDIDIADYPTAEVLVRDVTRNFGPKKADGVSPLDLFSSVGSAQADAEFFDEGRFGGFGFSYRTVDAATNDVRLSRVFSGSPAAAGGLERGQRFVSLNGRGIADILANEGLGAFFSNNDPVTFEMQPIVGDALITTITKDVVTIDPVPQSRIIDRDPGVPPVGYIELSTFVSTADAKLDAAFAGFRNASPPVNDVILDLRYNGGGLVSTANLLGNFLGALANDPSAAQPDDGNVFSETQFNADRAAANNDVTRFQRQDNSMDLGRLVVIATGGTASASELVTNSLDAWFDVTIVGASTFGKPVGQIGLRFCDKILRPTSFKTVNALRQGDYFDGLTVDCPAPDDLNEPVGADSDPNMVAAMTYLDTGACPPVASAEGQLKLEAQFIEKPELRGPAHREFANAY